MFDLHPADVAALLLYLVGVTALGIWSARRVKDMSDFVMPRRFGKTLMVFFAFGTGTHSDHAVGVAAKSYTNGVSGIWYQWLWLFASPFYWLIAPVMRRFRALTTADIYEARYDRSVSVLYALVGLAIYAVNIGVMLKGSSAVIEACTGDRFPAEGAILLMTVLFVAYGVAGGLGAAVLTDFVQGVLTIVFSFLLLPYILSAVGGMDGLRESLPALSPDRDLLSLVAPAGITSFYIIIITFNALVGIVAQPHVLGNCAAGRTELDGQVGFLCGNLLKRICTIAWCLTGVAAIAFFAQKGVVVEDVDKVFGRVAHEFLPQILPGMLGLFLAGLLASVMSSCDAFMVASSGLFTANIYKLVVRDRSDRHYLIAARISSLLVVVAGVIFAFWVEGVLTGLEIFWKINSMLAIAFWLGLFWRRTTVAGAWASAAAAFGTWWVTGRSAFASWLGEQPLAESLGLTTVKGGSVAVSLPWQMVAYLIAGTAAGILVSLVTRPVAPERLERYYSLCRTPVRPDEETPAPCRLPEGVVAPEPRRLLPASTGLELPVPSGRTLVGFLAAWGAVGAIVGVFVWIVKG